MRNETFMCSISFKFNPLHFIVYPTDFRNQAWYHKLWATVLGWQERWNRCGRHEKEKKSLSTFNCLYFRRLRSKQEKRRAVQRSSRDKKTQSWFNEAAKTLQHFISMYFLRPELAACNSWPNSEYTRCLVNTWSGSPSMSVLCKTQQELQDFISD